MRISTSLPDLEVPAQHRIDLPLPGPGGKIDRVLIESRRLGARRYAWLRGLGGAAWRCGFILCRAGDKIGQALVQLFDRDLAATLRQSSPAPAAPGPRLPAAPDSRCPERTLVAPKSIEAIVQASLIRSREARREGRGACIARLEPVEGAGQVARQARLIDLVVPQETLEVGVLRLT